MRRGAPMTALATFILAVALVHADAHNGVRYAPTGPSLSVNDAYTNAGQTPPSAYYEIALILGLFAIGMFIAMDASALHNRRVALRERMLLHLATDVQVVAAAIVAAVRAKVKAIQLVCHRNVPTSDVDALCEAIETGLQQHNVQCEVYSKWSESFRESQQSNVAICTDLSASLAALKMLYSNRRAIVAFRSSCDMQQMAGMTCCTANFVKHGLNADVHRTIRLVVPRANKVERCALVEHVRSLTLTPDELNVLYVRVCE